MNRSAERSTQWLVWGLILLGVAARLLPHLWNATPVTAIALLGATYLSKRWGILLPLTIVAVSDLVLGWHTTIPFTWGAFAAIGLLGWWLRKHPSPARIVVCSLAGSMLFFLVTNFGVWLVGGLYPNTPEGLWQCYVAAIPFFRNTLLGDLLSTGTLFGLYATAGALRVIPVQVRSHSR